MLVPSDPEEDRAKAIAAYEAGVLSRRIVIYPTGRRTARRVQTAHSSQIRLYLGGRIFKRGATAEEARAWIA